MIARCSVLFLMLLCSSQAFASVDEAVDTFFNDYLG